MRWLYVCFALLLIFISGCTSTAKHLEQNKFCEKIKDDLNLQFQMYGMFLMPGTTVNNMHYCEFFLGPVRALNILYSEEPDPERAYVTAMQAIKANSVANGYSLLSSDINVVDGKTVFTATFKKPKSGEQKTTVYVANDFSSITASATYAPGIPNPFVEPTLLRKIAVRSLNLTNS
jgi:hypothetical protein